MVSITFSIDSDSRGLMESFSWVNWSDVARELFLKRVKKHEALERLSELTKNSTLTDEDCLELGNLAKKGIWERLKRQL